MSDLTTLHGYPGRWGFHSTNQETEAGNEVT